MNNLEEECREGVKGDGMALIGGCEGFWKLNLPPTVAHCLPYGIVRLLSCK